MQLTYLFFHLIAFQTDPGRERELILVPLRSQNVAKEFAAPNLTAYRKRQIVERFNKLVEALEEFSKAHNESNGQIWPLDKARAVQKAIRELQEVEPSFKAFHKP